MLYFKKRNLKHFNSFRSIFISFIQFQFISLPAVEQLKSLKQLWLGLHSQQQLNLKAEVQSHQNMTIKESIPVIKLINIQRHILDV